MRRGVGEGAWARTSPRWRLLIVAVAALEVAGAITVGVTGRTGGAGAPATPGASGGWDPRILPIVRFVERDRGLSFLRPVPVSFLSRSAFEAQLTRGATSGPADATYWSQVLGELRALGMAHGNLDLGRLETEADAGSTVGYYDTDTKRLYVEGTSLTPYVRVTVAHELTHALQDQHLGLTGLDGRPDDQQVGISALVEGDAVVVENDYRSTFSDAEEAAYESEAAAFSSAPGAAPPQFLTDQATFPYDFGPTFVDALLASGGTDALDQSFSHPPTSENEIADPSMYLDGRHPVAVAWPAIPAGGAQLQPVSPFGQVSLAEVLGARLGYPAWAAVQGWRGDSSVLYSLRSRTCVAIDVSSDSADDAVTLGRAASRWAGGAPAASATTNGNLVEIRACDPGPSAPAGPEPSPSMYDDLAARAALVDQLINGDDPSADQAECVADATIASIGIAAAVDYEDGASGALSDAQLGAAERAVAGRCPSPDA